MADERMIKVLRIWPEIMDVMFGQTCKPAPFACFVDLALGRSSIAVFNTEILLVLLEIYRCARSSATSVKTWSCDIHRWAVALLHHRCLLLAVDDGCAF
jgi:hypothetical protein